MDALTLFWQLGQTLSLIGLAAGAVLTFRADEPYFGRYVDRPSTRYSRLEDNSPMNHRLLLKAEWWPRRA